VRRTFAVLLACGLVAAACGGDDGDDASDAGDTGSVGTGAAGGGEPYVLGFASDLSGVFAGASQGVLAGTQGYFELLNAEGGIDGHPVELEIRDDRTDVQVAVGEIRDLAE